MCYTCVIQTINNIHVGGSHISGGAASRDRQTAQGKSSQQLQQKDVSEKSQQSHQTSGKINFDLIH